ncbi:ABC transporter substrate-binding protein [Conexibacter sp. CPCC 206217]|uniref:ABC transporter substrate-binding protein n=1 Tax=Conexibacter sp. CPCC 206217 TaxID=3064574 RepID=UPI00272192F1|nr:ABC transporter substrate-binding protein [Conexibacter sp. CPCC 206217]MDO8211034.1 ABC transporter substrate-binding protein [Conexibacter sp. CPCC 206217]
MSEAEDARHGRRAAGVREDAGGGHHVSRRELIKRSAVVAAGGITLPMLLAACGDSSDGGSGSSTAAVPAGRAPRSVLDNASIRELFPMGGANDGSGVTLPTGMLMAMTGTGAFYGKVMSRGAKLAARQIAAMGGTSFPITIADHKSGDVQAGVTGTRKLITQDKVKTLLTSYGAVTVAIVPLIAQYRVLTLNGGGPDPSQVGKPWLYMTRMFAGDDQVAGGLAWLASAYPNVKRLAVVGTSENAVDAQKVLIPKWWPQLGGGRVVALQETTEAGATDFSNAAARIRSSNADAVFTFNTGNDYAYLLKQLRESGFDGPVLGIEFTEDAQKIAGRYGNTYTFTADYFDSASENPFARQFVEAYRAEYGEDPELYAANYYEAVFIVFELVRRVQEAGEDPTDSSQLERAIAADPRFLSVYGGTASRAGTLVLKPDHTTEKPQGIYSVVNGRPKLLAETRKVARDADPRTALLTDNPPAR